MAIKKNRVEFEVVAQTKSLEKAKKKADELEKKLKLVSKNNIANVNKQKNKELALIKQSFKNREISHKQFLERTIAAERKASNRVLAINKKTAARIDRVNKSRGTGGATGAAPATGGGIGGKLGGLGKGLVIGAAVAAGKALTSIGERALTTAARLDDLQKRFQVVFGTELPRVEAAAQRLAAAQGLSNNAFKEAISFSVDLLKPLGLTAKQATTSALKINQLAAAQKEFNNDQRSAKEVTEVFNKALLGERDGLVSFGLKLSEATIQAKLAEKGQKDLTGAALQQAKAQITLDEIWRQSADALTTYDENGDSLTRQLNDLKSATDDTSEGFFKLLSNAFLPLLEIITPLIRGFGKLFSFINKGFASLKNPAKALIANLKEESAETLVLVKRYDNLNKIKNKTALQNIELAETSEELTRRALELGIAIRDETGALIDQSDIRDQILNKDKSRTIDRLRVQAKAEADDIEFSARTIERLEKDEGSRFGINARAIKNEEQKLATSKKNIAIFNAEIENLQKKQDKILQKPPPARRAPKKGKTKKEDFTAELTTVKELEEQKTAIIESAEQDRNNKALGFEEQRSIARESAALQEEIDFIEKNSRLTQVEIARNETAENLAKAETAAKKKELKAQLKLNNIAVKAEQNKLKRIQAARRKDAEIARFLASETSSLAAALLSEEEGAFLRFLANRLRQLTDFIAAELFIKGVANLANPFTAGIGAAQIAGAGVVAFAGEAAALGIESAAKSSSDDSTERPDFDLNESTKDSIQTDQNISTAATRAGEGSTVNNVTNNFDQSVNVEGDILDPREFNEKIIQPLQNEIATERGRVVFGRQQLSG